MTDPRKVIAGLLSKTVANGATGHEAASAKAMAEKLAAKHGISLTAFSSSHHQSKPYDPFTNPFAEANDRGKQAMYDAKNKAYKEYVKKQQQAKAANNDPWAWKGPKENTAEKEEKAYKAGQKAANAASKKAKQQQAEENAWKHASFDSWTGNYKSVGDFCEARILSKDYNDYEQIAREARNRFGGRTSAKSVAWYASKLRKEGRL